MKNKRKKLKWSMIVMLTACWFLPLALLTVIMLFLISNNINQQIKETIETSTEKAVEISKLRLTEAMLASKNATYNRTIRDAYYEYLKDHNSQKLYQEISVYLAQQYKYNTDFKSTILYFIEDPDILYYTYSNIAGSTYQSVQNFEKDVKEIIQNKVEEMDTYIEFIEVNGSVYMVRNMVTSQFKPFAVLIMELNVEDIFGSLESIWGYESASVFINNILVLGSSEADVYLDTTKERKFHSIYTKGRGKNANSFVYKMDEVERNNISYIVNLDDQIEIDQIYTIRWIFLLFLGFMIPLIVIVFAFFHKKVTRPIEKLANAYKEIEKEHYGYELVSKNVDEEFYYLNEAFNSMSNKLKYQFEKIYLEELALKDANIMALQLQINPHFLNNTLEIINWEARLGGNYKVSGMIEALSTMLEATMNRKKVSFIPLQEELNYIDAYLYIIKERYGENFAFEKEIEKEVLREEVPRLIIQPIVENAIEHGMDLRKKGQVKLTIYKKEDFLYIEILDNGVLSVEEKAKIEKILANDTEELSSLSMGIRNVNKRLKIIYGEGCGLKVKSDKDNRTVFTIAVKINK